MTLPIACLVLFAVVGTPAILTLFTLSASALTGFLIMIPMADAPKDKRVNFPSFSPSIFVCMLLAMALDYALFLFVRYREALDEELWKKMNEKTPLMCPFLIPLMCPRLIPFMCPFKKDI